MDIKKELKKLIAERKLLFDDGEKLVEIKDVDVYNRHTSRFMITDVVILEKD